MGKNDPCKKRCVITWDWIQKKMDREILDSFQKKFMTIFECMGIVNGKQAISELNKHANTYWGLTMKYINLVSLHPKINYNKEGDKEKYRDY